MYNVHNLLHLHEDVSFFQSSLNEISAFKYENHLYKIKKLVRKSQNPIAQVTKRISEIESSTVRSRRKETSFLITNKNSDRCFMLNNNKFAFMVEKRADGKMVCDCVSERHFGILFNSPCHSKLIDIMYMERDHVI